MSNSQSGSQRTIQALFSVPVLAAFLVGSLPILLPVLVYRSLIGGEAPG